MSSQEKDYIEVYKKLEEDRLGWGTSDEWTNQDFEKLSELIFEKTGVRLSASTLKRVWGKVKYDSAPALTTLNTLAQFSGHENWRNFKSSVSSQNGSSTISLQATVPAQEPDPDRKKRLIRRIVGRMAATIVLLGAAALLFITTLPKERIDPAKVKFDARVISDELPNSVVFTYSAGNIQTDSLVIQQSWDPKRRERVPSGSHQHSSIYYFPGIFQSKILLNEQVLKEQEVFIQTKGWRGILDQAPIPTYLGEDEIRLAGNSMQVDAEILLLKTGKTVFNNVWTDFYNIKEYTGVDGQNFSLEVSLQNTSMKEEVACQQVRITVLGSKGVIRIPLCSKGCTSAIYAYIGNTTVGGKDHDLSAFGCDFDDPQQLRCTVKDRQVKVDLNDKTIFTHDQPVDIGKVVGLVIGFEGPGKIFSAEIK